MAKAKPAPKPVHMSEEDKLWELAFSTDEATDAARVRIVLQGITDAMDIISSIGNEPLPGYIANGFAHTLRWCEDLLKSTTDVALKPKTSAMS